MVDVLILGIAREGQRITVTHGDGLAGVVVHDVAVGVTGVGVIRILIDTEVAVAIERTDGRTFHDTLCIFAIAEGILLLYPRVGNLLHLIYITRDVGID